ncbi:MAG: IgGFc-binding protein [Myxococcota bacterium]
MRSCDQDGRVVECSADGAAWLFTETCASGFECGEGACISLCESAARDHSFLGCEFFAASVDGYAHTMSVANPNLVVPLNALVTIDALVGGFWTVAAMLEVPPGATLTAGWQGPTPQAGISLAAAYRVTATLPVVLYQMQIGGSEGGATLLFPTAALGNDHRGLVAGPGGRLLILGTVDGTAVTVKPTAEVAAGAALPAIPAGGTWTGTLAAGDALLLTSAGDLTGSHIESEQPVAVFGTGPGSRGGGADRAEEQLLSIDKWGKRFVAARIVGSDNPAIESLWRIVAAVDDTTLALTPGAGTAWPAAPATLAAGGFLEVGSAGHFYIEADQGVLVAQIVAADLDLVLAPPIDNFLDRYFFANVAGEGSETLTVIAPAGSTVLLDGVPWTGTWEVAGGDFQVSQAVNPTGSHTLAGAFGATPDAEPAGLAVLLRSHSGACTFSYMGALRLAPINATLK